MPYTGKTSTMTRYSNVKEMKSYDHIMITMSDFPYSQRGEKIFLTMIKIPETIH